MDRQIKLNVLRTLITIVAVGVWLWLHGLNLLSFDLEQFMRGWYFMDDGPKNFMMIIGAACRIVAEGVGVFVMLVVFVYTWCNNGLKKIIP